MCDKEDGRCEKRHREGTTNKTRVYDIGGPSEKIGDLLQCRGVRGGLV